MESAAAPVCLALVIAMLTGCGKKSDMEVRFEAEKLLSDADRQRDRLQIGQGGDIAGDFGGTIAAYNAVVNTVMLPSDNDDLAGASDERRRAWNLGLLARTRIASMYMDERELDSAYEYYRLVFVNPAAEDLQKNVVLRFMAAIKETQGNFDQAADLYDSVSTDYLSLINPDVPEMDALSAPIKRVIPLSGMWIFVGKVIRSLLHAMMGRSHCWMQRRVKESMTCKPRDG